MRRTAVSRMLFLGLVLLLLWPTGLEAQEEEWGFGGAEQPPRAAQTDLELLSGAWGRPAIGPENAPITIVEFSDFECPFCSRSQSTLSEIQKAYPDRVRLVFRHLPLNFHKNASRAARAAEAAHQQGAFSRYKSLLFENQKSLARDELIEHAERIGLDRSGFVAHMDSSESRDAVDADLAWAQKLGVRGTPSFFINGVRLVGAQPASAFETVIEEELRRAELLDEGALDGYRSRSEALTAINMADVRHMADKVSGGPALQPVGLEESTTAGPDDALLTLVVFTDPLDPEMARLLAVIGEIQVRYGEQLRIDWRPLPRVLHTESETVSALMQLAGQKSEDELYRLLYCLGELHLAGNFAEDLAGLSAAMLGCTAPPGVSVDDVEDDHLEWARSQRQLARAHGVSGEHGFFVNGHRVAKPFDEADALLLAEERYELARRAADELGSEAVYDWIVATNTGGKRQYLPVGNRPASGADDAPVTMSVFLDPGPGTDTDLWQAVQSFKTEYGEDLRVVYYLRPVSGSALAASAARAVLAAHKQGRFEDYTGKLISNQHRLSDAFLEEQAVDLGLDAGEWRKDVKRAQGDLDKDLSVAREAGVVVAPAVVLNGVFVEPEEEKLRAAIDEELTLEEEVRAQRGNVEYYRWITGAFLPDASGLGPIGDEGETRVHFDLSSRPVKGPRDALVTIIEATDYECPYCQKVQPTLEQLAADYGDDVRFSVVHFPLAFHQNAEPAARAAWSAQRQGKFWQYHEALFSAQDALSDEEFFRIAEEQGLDVDRFTSDFDGQPARRAVETDISDAKAAGVTGTPSFFINGRKVSGARPHEDFAAVIDEELQRAQQLLDSGQVKKKRDIYKATTRGVPPFVGAKARVRVKGVPSSGSRKSAHQVALFVDANQKPSLEALQTLSALEDLDPDGVETLVIPLGGEEAARVLISAKNAVNAAAIVELWQADRDPDRLAAALGISDAEMSEWLGSGDVSQEMKRAEKAAEKFDVLGSPTWVIDGVPVRRKVSAGELKRWLEL